MIDRFLGEYDWLSNFYPCEVTYKGKKFPSVENAYQCAKLDTSYERDMTSDLQSCSPGQAKRLGSKYGRNCGVWQSYKLVVMKDLLDQKFGKPDFARLLLNTGDQKIIEGNNWGDTFWGICNGRGANHLGCMIQEIRTQLKRSVSEVTEVQLVSIGNRRELRAALSDDVTIAVGVSDSVNELAAASEALRHLAHQLDYYAKKGTKND